MINLFRKVNSKGKKSVMELIIALLKKKSKKKDLKTLYELLFEFFKLKEMILYKDSFFKELIALNESNLNDGFIQFYNENLLLQQKNL